MSNKNSPTGTSMSNNFYKLMGFVKETPPPRKIQGVGSSAGTRTDSDFHKLMGFIEETPPPRKIQGVCSSAGTRTDSDFHKLMGFIEKTPSPTGRKKRSSARISTGSDLNKLMGFVKETPSPTSASSNIHNLMGFVKEKPPLPEGWVVRQSNTYLDRVYYFNVLTGATTWKLPELSSSDDASHTTTSEISEHNPTATCKDSPLKSSSKRTKAASTVSQTVRGAKSLPGDKSLPKTRQLRSETPVDKTAINGSRIPSMRNRIEKYKTDQKASLYKLGQKADSKKTQADKDGKVDVQQFKDSRSEHINKRRQLSDETFANPWPSPPWGIPLASLRLPGTSTPESLTPSSLPSRGIPSDISSVSSGSKMGTPIRPPTSKRRKRKTQGQSSSSSDSHPAPSKSTPVKLPNGVPEVTIPQSQNRLPKSAKKPSVSSLSSSDKEGSKIATLQQLSGSDVPNDDLRLKLKRARRFQVKSPLSEQSVKGKRTSSSPIPHSPEVPVCLQKPARRTPSTERLNPKPEPVQVAIPPLPPDEYNDDNLCQMEIDFPNEEEVNTTINANCSTKELSVHVVLDTNVLMHDLHFVRNLLGECISGLGGLVLVIPWVVMQELDRLKTESTCHSSNKAIQFLHKCFTNDHPRVKGEPLRKVSDEPDFEITCNDDWILQCCLQYQRKVGKDLLVLLSNDKHLCSKAIISSIKAYCIDTLLPGLKSLASTLRQRPPVPPESPVIQNHDTSVVLEHNSSRSLSPIEPPISAEAERELCDKLLCDLKEVLCSGLSAVLEAEMKAAYEDLWLEIILKKPPWSFSDVMQCYDKHWMAIFGLFLNREDKRRFQQLFEMTDEGLEMGLQRIKQLVNSSIFFCRRLHQHKSYNNKVLQSITRLGELKKRCVLPPEANERGGEEVVFQVFQTVWMKILQLSALIFEGLGVPHDLETDKTAGIPTPGECRNCLQLLCQMLEQIIGSVERVTQIPDSFVFRETVPFKHLCTVLHSFLHEFSTQDTERYAGLTMHSLQRFVLVVNNKNVLRNGIVQFTNAFTKLAQCHSALS